MSKGIYCWYIPVSNKIYIGPTITAFKKRRREHELALMHGEHGNSILQRTYDKYGKRAFKFKVIERISTKRDLRYIRDIEQDWIDYFKENTNLLVVNLRDARDYSVINEETRERMAEAQIKYTYAGFIAPDGTVYENIRNINKFAREHGLTGTNLYDLVVGKKKIYNGWRSVLTPIEDVRLTPIYSFVSPSGEVYNDIQNLKLFCSQHGLSDSKMCCVWSGKRNTHKGWTKNTSAPINYRSKRLNTDDLLGIVGVN